MLSRLTADVAQVEFSVTQALTTWVRDALQLLALLWVCLVLDWRLFALSFVVFPAALIPITRFARAVKRTARTTQGRLGNLTALVGEQLGALPVVQAYGMEPRVRAAFDAEQTRYLREMDRSLLLRGSASPSIELLGITGAGAGPGGGRAGGERRCLAREPPHVLRRRGAPDVRAAEDALLHAHPGGRRGGCRRAGVRARGSPHAPGPRRGGPPAAAGVLRLEELRIQYGEVEALRGLTLELPAGSTVALVGASGAGKTTLFSALLALRRSRGWSHPLGRAGRAWLQPGLAPGAHRLGAAGASSLRRLGARRGAGRASPRRRDAEVWSALGRAHGAEFVRALPRGLDTAVGERGAQLSGGSGSGWPSPGRSCASRPFCFWTSPPAASTRRARRWCRRGWPS